jgi:hypothetical protein
MDRFETVKLKSSGKVSEVFSAFPAKDILCELQSDPSFIGQILWDGIVRDVVVVIALNARGFGFSNPINATNRIRSISDQIAKT